MKYKIALFLFWITSNISAQNSFRIEIDSLQSPVMNFCRLADGGYVLGMGAPSAGMVIKTDSAGVFEWSKSYGTQQLDINQVKLIPTSDSGFYFIVFTLDPMFAQYTSVHLRKINKLGNITASIKNAPQISAGEKMSFTAAEPITNKIYGIGIHYSKSSGGNPCCYEPYFLEFDTALNVSNITPSVSRASNITQILFGNIPSGFLTDGGDGGNPILVKLNTNGIPVWQMSYNSAFDSGIASIVQSDSCFFILEGIGNMFGIRKIDFSGNTIFSVIYTSPAIWDTFYYLKMNIANANSFLISGLFKKSPNGFFFPIMMNVDSTGNVINAMEGVDSLYNFSGNSIGEEAFLFSRSSTFPMPTSYQFEKIYNSSSTCNYVAKTFIASVNASIDSAVYNIPLGSVPAFINSPLAETAQNHTLTYLCNTSSIPESSLATPSEGISCYPNPVKEKFFIKTKYTDELLINIYDIQCKSVHSLTIYGDKEINISDLNKGLYFLNIYHKGNIKYSQKILKIE